MVTRDLSKMLSLGTLLFFVSSAVYADTRCKVDLVFGGWMEGCPHLHGDEDPRPGGRTPEQWLDHIRNALHVGAQGCRGTANWVKQNNPYRRGLTEYEKYYLTPWFGRELDLDRVRVHWGARLNEGLRVAGHDVWVASGAQTFGYNIYLRERHDQGDTKQLIDLAHELFHTLQHETYGGLHEFCKTYMNGWVDGGMNYYRNPLEKEAFDFEVRFANSLSNLESTTNFDIEFTPTTPYNNRSIRVPERLYTQGRRLGRIRRN